MIKFKNGKPIEPVLRHELFEEIARLNKVIEEIQKVTKGTYYESTIHQIVVNSVLDNYIRPELDIFGGLQ